MELLESVGPRPRQARYQAALRPDYRILTYGKTSKASRERSRVRPRMNSAVPQMFRYGLCLQRLPIRLAILTVHASIDQR
jgi:hypothetical protein